LIYRGSRKHVLDWTARPEFPAELAEMIRPCPVEIGPDAIWMPRGYDAPDEARLETFGPAWFPGHPAWGELTDWWLVHKHRANTPNWDIAVGCTIEARPGLVLVEAKANWPELSSAGKLLRENASRKSRENHERIGAAIEEANAGWKRLDPGVHISRDTHYQLANRLAFTWKLGTLGIPVVLVYLGFTGDEGIRYVGAPFEGEGDWERAFRDYTDGVFPEGLLEQFIDLGAAPVWVLSRARAVREVSPIPSEQGKSR